MVVNTSLCPGIQKKLRNFFGINQQHDVPTYNAHHLDACAKKAFKNNIPNAIWNENLYISELRKRTQRAPTAGHWPQYRLKIEPKNARHFDNLEIITKPKTIISFSHFLLSAFFIDRENRGFLVSFIVLAGILGKKQRRARL